MAKYWIDANILIEPAKGLYRLDIAPAFWQALEVHAQLGTIRSSSLVFTEIAKGHGALAEWVKDHEHPLFVDPNIGVQAVYRQIATWVEKTYGPPHTKRFLDGADAWIIAHAQVDEATVVTFEKPAQPQRGAHPKIPSVCMQFGVACVSLYEMQQDLGIRWV